MNLVLLFQKYYPGVFIESRENPSNKTLQQKYENEISADPKPTWQEFCANQEVADYVLNPELEAQRGMLWKEIKATFLSKRESLTVSYENYTYQGDVDSSACITTAVSDGEESRNWLDVNNVRHLLTKSALQAVLGLINSAVEDLVDRKEALRTLKDNATTIEEINQVRAVIDSGWPTFPYTSS